METNYLHLGIAFDQNYLTPFYVLVTSIFQNNKHNSFHIHAIITGVTEPDKEAICLFVNQHHSLISFYLIDPNKLDGLVVPKNMYFTVAAYYRLFFPLLLPNTVQKLLYLDTDTIVLDDLAALYDIDVSGYPLAAVAEVRATKNRPDLGIYEVGIYFNSGVMLLNIPEWNAQHITEKALQFVQDFPEKIVFVDQDALNVVLQNNYLKLDARFNVLPFDIPRFLPRKQYSSFLSNKTLIHYSLRQYKPWNRGCASKFRHLYYGYLQQSPRCHEHLYQSTPITVRTILTSLKVWAMETVINLPKATIFLAMLFGEDLDSYR